ncbi:MAG: glycosyltransferase [Verrucomicrobia bacterium]|nr:glycosyltransferase [Verrucomicrobiota bacterium]
MRAMVISHACVAEDNRAKWECLARDGKTRIELHLPHRWPSWESRYRPSPQTADGFDIRVAHAFRTGREDQYFFAPRVFRGLRRGAFDILHVEQGAAAFVYFQSLLERNLFSRRTKTCFFTWINWEYPLRWPWNRIEPHNLRHSDGAIGGNNEAVDILRRHGFRGKTAVIPQLGVDTEYYSPAPNDALRVKLGLRGVVIGFVGRLVEEKGIRLLLEAAERLESEISLLLLGSGPLERELDQTAASGRLRIARVAAVAHEQVRDYLRAMDILALPSYSTPAWKEQFGHVLIEAMACEIPVVGSSSAAIPEVIGNAGLIFRERSAEELTSCLNALISSPAERRRMGRLGRLRVLERFTHQEIARQTLEFWKTL